LLEAIEARGDEDVIFGDDVGGVRELIIVNSM